MDWNKIWETIKEFFTSNGWNIIKFFAVLFIGISIIKILLNVLKKLFGKTHVEKITVQFALGIVKFLLYLFLTLTLLNMLGMQVNGILTAFSAILLAVGVALEKNIANFANGLIIVTTHMFSKGDYIMIFDDVEGVISDINFLFTTLVTTDNRKVTLPNSKIMEESVTNNGAFPTRRVQITFSVAYDSDIELVKKVVTDVMKANGKVYLDKPIFCRLKTMSASSLDFYSYCWVDKSDYWDVYYYLMETVYNEFKRNGISVPYNQLEVRNRTDVVTLPVIGKSLPKRVEKERNTKEAFSLENSDLTKLFKFDRNKKRRKKKNNNSNNTSKQQTTEQKPEQKEQQPTEQKAQNSQTVQSPNTIENNKLTMTNLISEKTTIETQKNEKQTNTSDNNNK